MAKSAPMHINVNDILADVVGTTQTFTVTDERLEIPELEITGPVAGKVMVARDDSGIALKGTIQFIIQLECHRCLQAYALPLQLDIAGQFAREPDADQWPITADDAIDIAPLIRDEALINVPLQQICRTDCPGLCDTCGQLIDSPHDHPEQTIKHQPKIIIKKD
jgi:uncharacterized protein